ncbi:larval cuticle protein 2-like [Hetaerina americana]|uniref:larval cuticle protein 2-like n=1 Tax=Hetaerina americana TaxID=62018 RepID=UPI003A7F57C9
MYKSLLLVAVLSVGVALAQYNNNPQRGYGRDAAILSEARYQAGDGAFGAAYLQEDGVEFKEETDADGNRKGSYSYVDPEGNRRTVHYTAGKNGFIASGDHLPRAPPAPLPVAPKPQYQPQPQYNPAPQPQYQSQYQPQPQYNPAPQPQYQPAPVPQQYNTQTQHYASPPAPQRYNAQPQYNQVSTTPAPHRFYPPGKLNLNRTPGGYSYTFSKD